MKVLLVEDNTILRENIANVLISEGYVVQQCSNGEEAEYLILNNSSDIVLLDRMLPGEDGLSVTKTARLHHITTPIILLTALNTIGDKITGLDAGADDYIIKPFDMGELLARLRIWSRRIVPLENPNELSFGDLCYLPKLHLLKGPFQDVVLPKRLAQFVELLLRNSQYPLSRQMIFNRIWGPDADVNDSIIDTYAHLLRNKLAAIGSCVKIINNRGMGYRLEQRAEK